MNVHTPLKDQARTRDSAHSVRIALPLPPSANNMFVNVRGKGRVRSENYKSWSRTAGLLIRAQRPGRFDVPVRVRIEVNHPRGLGFDIDNRIKAILDALVQYGLLIDDSAKWVRGVEIVVVESGAECLVEVEALRG
jgi:Holliday junction resolvase